MGVDEPGTHLLIHLGRTGCSLCPITALVNYLAIRPGPPGPLFVFQDGSPLIRDAFVCAVKQALEAAKVDSAAYSGHSFWISAATVTAKSGVPAFMIKLLGRWESEAFQLYIQLPRESLTAISRLIA